MARAVARMESVVTIEEVLEFATRRGNVRYVARDTDGNEYTTFRESIGAEAKRLQGERVRIEYHENQRGRYTNVYLRQGRVRARGALGGSRHRPRRGGLANRGRGGAMVVIRGRAKRAV